MRESMVGEAMEVSDINLRDPDEIQSIQEHFVSVAPAPVLTRLERLDNWVFGMTVVRAGMFVLGCVATSYVSTGKTEPQVDPAIAHFQTLFAALSAGRDFADFAEMCALCGHGSRSC